jgi:molybdopterin/thiamine biosynthesis adenylyltransferase/rhodanese-related sulfurtransferase
LLVGSCAAWAATQAALFICARPAGRYHTAHSSRRQIFMLSAAELARYSRHLALREIGAEGQEKLKAARVLVIGAGGLGSPSALYLAASGVGTIGVVDHDCVDISNLQRQVLYDTASVGRAKADAAKDRLLALNPLIELAAHQVELRAANVRAIFGAYDIVLDGTDRFATRYLANDACVVLRKPLVSAAIHRFEGQAMTYVPGRGPCYRCLFPVPPTDGLVPNCAEAGVLGVLPGVMGTIQATEAIKLIVGAGEPLLGRLLAYDALAMRFSEFRFSRRSDCAVCGDSPTITQPQDAIELCSADAVAGVTRLSPARLRDLLGQAAIVDVREPREFAVSRLPRAINIPVGELQRRVGELTSATSAVFVCRSGARSLAASAIAARAGIANVAHLEGGLLAWAEEVDRSFEVAPAG